MNQDEDAPEFELPENLLEKLYELSGGSDKYKGFILCNCSENGSPTIFSKFDSTVVELGLRKTLEQWLLSNESNKEDYNDL